MRTKKAIIFSILIIAVTVISLITTTAIVFAADEVKVISNVNINFTAVDIDGEVSASYTLGNNGTPVSFVMADLTQESGTVYKDESGNVKTYLEFKTEEDNTESTVITDFGSLILPDNDGDEKSDIVTISPSQRFVILTYTFKNTGALDYTARMDFNSVPTTDNMTIEYATNTLDYSQTRKALVVEGGETAFYYIKITVNEVGYDALFECDLSWLLEKYEAIEGEQDFEIGDVDAVENEDGTYSVSYNGAPLQNGTLFFPSTIGTAQVTNIVSASSTVTDEQKNLVTKIVIADGIKTIERDAFASKYNNLTEVTIPDSVELIDSNAFKGCSKLEVVNISSNSKLKIINNAAFMDCTSLISILLPEGLEKINSLALYNTKISELRIPSTLYSIGYGFCSSSLKSITLAEGAELNYSKLFLNNNKCLVEIATKRLIIGLDSCTLNGINVDDNLDNALTDDEIDVIQIDNYAIMSRGLSGSITIPEGIVYLGNYAFNANTNITAFNLPDSLREIGNRCFNNNTKLNSIHIPENVSKISNGAFVNCLSLTSITVDKNNLTYTSGFEDLSGNWLEYNCIVEKKENNASLIIGCSNTIIPEVESVNVISNEAFYGQTNLTSIIIPENIKKIGAQAFRQCSSLTSIIFYNTDNWYIYSVNYTDINTAEANKESMQLVDGSLFESMHELIIDNSSNYCKYYWYYLP